MAKKTMILYTKNGLSYLPHCTPVKTIEIEEEVTECHEDLAIKMNTNKINIKAYINKFGIISKNAKRALCTRSLRHFVFGNNIVTQSGSTLTLKMKKQLNHIELRDLLNLNVKNPNMYNHDDVLKETSFGIDQAEPTDFTESGENDYSIIENEKPTVDSLHETVEKIKDKFHRAIYITTAIFAVIVILVTAATVINIVKCVKSNNVKIKFIPETDKVEWITDKAQEQDRFQEVKEVATHSKAKKRYKRSHRMKRLQLDQELGLQHLFDSSGR
jgi:hypothetical protein